MTPSEVREALATLFERLAGNGLVLTLTQLLTELPARQQRRVPGRGRIDRRERRFKQALRAGHVIGAEKFRADGSVLERSTRKPSALGKQPSGAVPLLDDRGAGLSLGEWELQLLWAISSLDALDVLVLLQRDEARTAPHRARAKPAAPTPPVRRV